MHPQFHIEMVRQRSRDLENRLERRRLLTAEQPRNEVAADAVSVRHSRVSDELSLERLAALEGQQLAPGGHLVAEVNGEVVAALPLTGGEPIADPFRPTAHLLPLLRRRAAQLCTPPRPRRGPAIFKHRFA
jgi:hypothetical protein